MFTRILVVVALYMARVLADVALLQPRSGQTFSGSSGTVEIDVSWRDDTDDTDDDMSLSKLKSYVISLCTGTDSNIQCLQPPVQKGSDVDGAGSLKASFKSSLTGDGMFFFQFYTTFAEDAHTIHYTNRFELTDMAGDSKVLTAPYTITGPAPSPQTEYKGASIDTRSFTLAYTQQTGLSRFAPMQLQPGTDPITRTDYSMRYPTSAVSYFPSIKGTPTVKTTVTAGWSYTIKSVHNWATVAPYPTVAYAAKDKVTSASLGGAAKRKRWLD